NILEVLVRQLAPLLSFTCDEVWEFYPEGLREDGRALAVQLAGWPTAEDFAPRVPADEGQRLLEDFTVVLGVRDAVTKALEEARGEKVIGKSQEARVEIAVAPLAAEVLAGLPGGTLEELFIVAEVGLAVEDGLLEPQVRVLRAAGEKCPRCWNIRALGADPHHPAVCGRCAAVLTELGFAESEAAGAAVGAATSDATSAKRAES
ncbi:MAG: class I tRNA ligase family protein, partial [Coriobacteriales bacterium]|nr:class I tRNA ligase family protein [Coriobacteriales bacterium]